jgi:hypothetical protein
MVCRPKPYDRKNTLSAAKNMFIRIICSFILMAAFNAHADTVNYFLDNVILDDHTQMTGTFTWTYDTGDFENGVGQFTSLDIPHTSHDHTDLKISIDIGKTIEFTLIGNFASYCRCVDATRTSNGKNKGTGNAKAGNKYLSWAYSEAAHFAVRFEPLAQRFYERKKAKTNGIIAIRAVARKLARATWMMLKHQVPYDARLMFPN